MRWSSSAIGDATAGSSNADADINSYASVQELEALGDDRLKAVLERRGLKGGGTAQERAKRLWSVKDLAFEDIPNKLKAKKAAPSLTSGEGAAVAEAVAPTTAGKKALAWLEFQIIRLSELILDVVHKTRNHAEKQQTRSADEKQRELLEEEGGSWPP